MKYFQWSGYITIPATAVLPENATFKEVAEALAAEIDEAMANLYTPIFWDDVKGIEQIGEFDEDE